MAKRSKADGSTALPKPQKENSFFEEDASSRQQSFPILAKDPVDELSILGARQGREARIQLGFRVTEARYEELRDISFRLRIPMQTIFEIVIFSWLDSQKKKL